MPNYTRTSGSMFPEEIITLTNYQDATNEISSAIAQIKELQAQGDYVAIVDYLELYPDIKRYIIGSDSINLIEEETRNIEIYARNTQQQFFYQTTAPIDVMSEQDVWIGGDLNE